MRKHGQRSYVRVVAHSVALLVLLFLPAACGAAVPSPPQATADVTGTRSPAATAEDTSAPVPETSSTAAPGAAGEFDCAAVQQIPAPECAALVALYTGSSGQDWIDNRGWLATNTPCSWTGIVCTDDHVSHISLSNNRLEGSLPPALGELSGLRVLDLGANRLAGILPAELGQLSHLSSLHLWQNMLTGPIPPQLGDLDKLQSLSLAGNEFKGPIPPALGEMKSLETLDLSHNQLHGEIPGELGELRNLYALNLSHNQLSGAIPEALGSVNKLDEVDLSYNLLSGSVPASLRPVGQRMLWGNQLDGTISSDGKAPLVVDYRGVHFTADRSLATSIWPEVTAASTVAETADGPSYWLALPGHMRFTFADPGLSPARRRMGFNVAAEAQILVFPLAELAAQNPSVGAEIDALRLLLAGTENLPTGALPLLPLTNAAQVFHAQVQFLDTGSMRGIRYISQHSQDPHPIVLSHELFYTFQGLTNDGAHFVAAFFPLATDALPDTINIGDWDEFHDNYDSYLSQTSAGLDQLAPAQFTPHFDRLDALVSSLRIEPDAFASGGPAGS